MYSEIERENIFNYLVSKFEERDEILSLVQVGSGALGYKDKYSDIDIALVVKDNNIKELFDKTISDIKEKYNIVFSDSMEDRRLQVFLLDDYLELDIGYYTIDTIRAKRENYKVIFDKTNKVEEIMFRTWNEDKEKNKGTTHDVNMKDIVSYIDNELWYNVIHSVVAYKRNNKYRCFYELEQIKWYVIDLIAKRNSVESKRYRDINKLNESELIKIDSLFIYPNNLQELKEYLNRALTIIFEEFDYWKNKENISYIGSVDFYNKFIDLN